MMDDTPRVGPSEARAWIEAGEAVVLDTNPRRFDDPAVAIPGAVPMPPEEIGFRFPNLPHGCAVVLYCT